jgi:hypothetical protein
MAGASGVMSFKERPFSRPNAPIGPFFIALGKASMR